MSGMGKEAQGCSEWEDGDEAAVARPLLGKHWGSLGFTLAFAWRRLEGLLQCSQLAAEPLLTGLKPLLHQLLELHQLLVQLALDIGAKDGNLACRLGKEHVRGDATWG